MVDTPNRPVTFADAIEPTDIAPPGQTHAAYTTYQKVPTEPRDVVVQATQHVSIAQRIAAKARARANALIEIALPDAGVTVKALPKPFDTVMSEVGFPSFVTKATQVALMDSQRDLNQLSPDERVKLAEDVDAFARKVGFKGLLDMQRMYFHMYPLACLVEPECVATEAEITDPDRQIALEWLTANDRAAIFNACQAEKDARLAAVAPFPDQAPAP